MQQRYCLCGRPVWVRYLFTSLCCLSEFLDSDGAGGRSLSRCPCCHRRLDIDELC